MINEQSNIYDESEYIIIPNPIYDVVFRYLMEDPESATIVLSTLINEKIKTLHLEPLTHTEKQKPVAKLQDPLSKNDINLFHLDFTATVELPDGSEELIMIELQKATEPGDIFRFKRYISKNFQKKHEKEIINLEDTSVKKVTRPIRLIPIFILNFRIENEINDLLIRTNRIKTGVFKNKNLEKHNEFIDNLSYDIWVVQLPNLSNISESEYESDEYKKKLFALLKLFDQKSKVKNNEHRLRLIRRFFPGFLERVIRRLQSADANNPNLEEQLYAEDEILKALLDSANQISALNEQIVEKDKTIEEKDKSLVEKNKALNEEKERSNNKDKIILELAKTLKDSGFTIDAITQKTGFSIEEIENL